MHSSWDQWQRCHPLPTQSPRRELRARLEARACSTSPAGSSPWARRERPDLAEGCMDVRCSSSAAGNDSCRGGRRNDSARTSGGHDNSSGESGTTFCSAEAVPRHECMAAPATTRLRRCRTRHITCVPGELRSGMTTRLKPKRTEIREIAEARPSQSRKFT